MSKVRITHIEMEDEGQGIVEVIRAYLGQAQPQALHPVAAAPVGELAPPPSIAELVAPAVVKSRKSIPAVSPKAVSAPRSAPGGGDSITTRIMEALQKKPMSSIELAQSLKLEPGQIYAPAHLLKKKGVVDNRIDETDGTRRYFIK